VEHTDADLNKPSVDEVPDGRGVLVKRGSIRMYSELEGI
jgi:hypothetical protein